MKLNKSDKILILVIISISLINLLQYINRADTGGILVFSLGVILVSLQLLKKRMNTSLLYTWIFVQLPILITSTFIYAPTTSPFNLSVGITSNVFELKLNIIPLFFFGLYKVYQMNSLIGETFEIKAMKTKNENILNNYFPIKCEALELIKVNNDKNKWIKLKIEEPILINNITYDFFIVKSKDDKVYDKKTFLPSHIKIGNDEKTLAVKGWVLIKKAE